MKDRTPTIAVLGASGLIGMEVTRFLTQAGFSVVPFARRLGSAQRHALGPAARTVPFLDLDTGALSRMLADANADVVINCVGILQDGPTGQTSPVHEDFVARLLAAIGALDRPLLLIHLSVPGDASGDATAFSLSKRRAENLIAQGGMAHVIIRPGFVIAPSAFGGSALIRGLAALPFDLPPLERSRPFAATAADDIGQTCRIAIETWCAAHHHRAQTWDVMEAVPGTVGDVLDRFRLLLGGPRAAIALPSWAMDLGARLGDCAGALGWSPPIRTTALREMRRGVEGNPAAWMEATGITPATLADAAGRLRPSIQEIWFSRLYLLKAVILVALSAFWIASGVVALTVAFGAAVEILTRNGIPPGAATALTILTSLGDIAIGAAIAVRRTSSIGLLAGIAVALGYAGASVFVAPELWIDPLGSMLKIVPAVLLMLVALALQPNR